MVDAFLAVGAHGLCYAGAVALIGAGAFAEWVAPELAKLRPTYLRRLMALGAVACGLGTLLVPVQVVHQLGARLADVLPTYLLRTRQGPVLLVRLLLVAALAWLGGARLSDSRVRRLTWGAVAVALMVSVGLAGHSGGRLDLLLAHLVHLASVSVWGGVVVTLAAHPGWGAEADGNPEVVLQAVQRVSRLGSVAFPALVVAGAYLAMALTGGLGGLPAAGYGRWLLLKLLLVVLVAGAAATNRWWLLPASRSRSLESSLRLRRCVRAEAGLLLAVLVVTAMLSTQPPPMAPGS